MPTAGIKLTQVGDFLSRVPIRVSDSCPDAAAACEDRVSLMRTLTVEELLGEFQDCSDRERLQLILEFGDELPPLAEQFKTEEFRVRGCQSNVWLITKLESPNGQPVVEIIADSDAMIVKGLIAVLLIIYTGKTPEEILAVDVKDIFEKLGLDRHLSTARKNGLNGMVKRIRELAAMSVHPRRGEKAKGEE